MYKLDVPVSQLILLVCGEITIHLEKIGKAMSWEFCSGIV